MKRLCFLLFFILLSGSVMGASLGEFSIENPRVIVTYTKDVALIDRTILSLDADNPVEYILTQTEPPQPPNGTLLYAEEYVLITEELTDDGESEVQSLVPGEYQIILNARDRQGVSVFDSPTFTITGLEIMLIEPALGLADHHPFDVQLLTVINNAPAEARCEYSPVGFDAPMTLVSSGFQTDHVIRDLDYRGSLYVVCEEHPGRRTSHRFSIDWDETSASITAIANPDLVRDPRDKSTMITIETDDETVCTIDGKAFGNGVPGDQTTYATFHEERYFYNDITDEQEHVFEHRIECANRAGLKEHTTLTVTVDFSLHTAIDILSPDSVINTPAFDLIVHPTFIADSCETDGELMNRDGDNFVLNYNNVEDGEYTFSITCTGLSDMTREFELMIDTVPPTITIDASPLICLNAINASWEAADANSIIGYRYSVSDDSGMIVEGETIRRNAEVQLTRSIEGTLVWEVSAEDEAGNIVVITAELAALREGQDEECGLPPFIQLLEPAKGFAPSTPYTVKISTARTAECRYSLQSGAEWTARSVLSSSDDLTHSKLFNFPDQELHVWCIEPNENNHTKTFRVGVDTTPPTIAIVAEPNPVIDPARKVVIMTVTTSDPTHCTFNDEKFDGDSNDPSTYSDTHVTTLDFRDVTSTQPISKVYTVECENLASLSNSKNYIVHIDLGAELSIKRISPDAFTSESFIALSVEPNLDASCLWRDADSTAALQSFGDVQGNIHTVALGNLDEGTHQYYVECTSVAEQGTAVINFVVDRVPPEITDLTGPTAACQGMQAKYTYNITGLDKLPVIQYTLQGPASVMFEKNTSDAFITIATPGLQPGRYELLLSPIGRTGLSGKTVRTVLEIIDATSEACSTPNALCGDGVISPGESCDGTNLAGKTCAVLGFDNGTLSCSSNCLIDTSSCFPQSTDEVCGDGIIGAGESCEEDDLDDLTCEDFLFDGGELTCSSCDLNTNFCTGSPPDMCSNGQRDAGEDGVDCGGLCTANCLVCVLDTECPITMSCEIGQCVELPEITTNLPPPDDQNRSANSPPVRAQPNTCSSDFECELDEECKDDRCVPLDRRSLTPGSEGQTQSIKGFDWLALTFIILGLLVMGGSGYYLYEQHETKGFQPSSGPGDDFRQTPPPMKGPPTLGTPPPQTQPPQVAVQREAMVREQMLEDIHERKKEKTAKRHETFGAFEGGTKPATPKKVLKPAPPKKAPKKKEASKDVFDTLEKL